MSKEIERKFLVNAKLFASTLNVLEAYSPGIASKSHITQGYLSTELSMPIRIREREYYGVDGLLVHSDYSMTVKANRSGFTCDEVEFDIPKRKFEQLFDLCGSNVLYKSRTVLSYVGNTWEVDVFHGALQGLILAEIELGEESQVFSKPAWIDREVTDDPMFSNAMLIKQRYEDGKLLWLP